MTAALPAPPALPVPTGAWPRLGWSLWPSRCLICAEAGLPGCDLCAACWAQWPRVGRSCLGCAMPLVAARAGSWGDDDGAGGGNDNAGDGDGDGDGDDADGGTGGNPLTDASSITAALPDRCGACLVRASPLSEVRAAALYRAPLDRLLPRFKFHRDLAAGRVLATTMAAAFAPLAERMRSASAAGTTPTFASAMRSANFAGATPAGATSRDGMYGPNRPACPARCGAPVATLIPVPLHRSRLRQRGYDQALELARPLSRRLGLRLCVDGLHRTRDTPPQSRLDAAQRRRNLAEAFVWIADAPPPAHAILIDDVMTTGATLHAAAQALRRAGAQRVDAWVCARTL